MHRRPPGRLGEYVRMIGKMRAANTWDPRLKPLAKEACGCFLSTPPAADGWVHDSVRLFHHFSTIRFVSDTMSSVVASQWRRVSFTEPHGLTLVVCALSQFKTPLGLCEQVAEASAILHAKNLLSPEHLQLLVLNLGFLRAAASLPLCERMASDFLSLSALSKDPLRANPRLAGNVGSLFTGLMLLHCTDQALHDSAAALLLSLFDLQNEPPTGDCTHLGRNGHRTASIAEDTASPSDGSSTSKDTPANKAAVSLSDGSSTSKDTPANKAAVSPSDGSSTSRDTHANKAVVPPPVSSSTSRETPAKKAAASPPDGSPTSRDTPDDKAEAPPSDGSSPTSRVTPGINQAEGPPPAAPGSESAPSRHRQALPKSEGRAPLDRATAVPLHAASPGKRDLLSTGRHALAPFATLLASYAKLRVEDGRLHRFVAACLGTRAGIAGGLDDRQLPNAVLALARCRHPGLRGVCLALDAHGRQKMERMSLKAAFQVVHGYRVSSVCYGGALAKAVTDMVRRNAFDGELQVTVMSLLGVLSRTEELTAAHNALLEAVVDTLFRNVSSFTAAQLVEAVGRLAILHDLPRARRLLDLFLDPALVRLVTHPVAIDLNGHNRRSDNHLTRPINRIYALRIAGETATLAQMIAKAFPRSPAGASGTRAGRLPEALARERWRLAECLAPSAVFVHDMLEASVTFGEAPILPAAVRFAGVLHTAVHALRGDAAGGGGTEAPGVELLQGGSCAIEGFARALLFCGLTSGYIEADRVDGVVRGLSRGDYYALTLALRSIHFHPPPVEEDKPPAAQSTGAAPEVGRLVASVSRPVEESRGLSAFLPPYTLDATRKRLSNKLETEDSNMTMKEIENSEQSERSRGAAAESRGLPASRPPNPSGGDAAESRGPSASQPPYPFGGDAVKSRGPSASQPPSPSGRDAVESRRLSASQPPHPFGGDGVESRGPSASQPPSPSGRDAVESRRLSASQPPHPFGGDGVESRGPSASQPPSPSGRDAVESRRLSASQPPHPFGGDGVESRGPSASLPPYPFGDDFARRTAAGGGLSSVLRVVGRGAATGAAWGGAAGEKMEDSPDPSCIGDFSPREREAAKRAVVEGILARGLSELSASETLKALEAILWTNHEDNESLVQLFDRRAAELAATQRTPQQDPPSDAAERRRGAPAGGPPSVAAADAAELLHAFATASHRPVRFLAAPLFSARRPAAAGYWRQLRPRAVTVANASFALARFRNAGHTLHFLLREHVEHAHSLAQSRSRTEQQHGSETDSGVVNPCRVIYSLQVARLVTPGVADWAFQRLSCKEVVQRIGMGDIRHAAAALCPEFDHGDPRNTPPPPSKIGVLLLNEFIRRLNLLQPTGESQGDPPPSDFRR
ncbi:hypothetical protein DIPPA_22209 [Diplonema papillatum]|nr:hypothetical protein DIPPA_22209 [Diplonema papillatum]